MECAIEKGVVHTVRNFQGRQELLVRLGITLAKAINYPSLTGPCQPGNEVLLNTTAEYLKLGSGGWHYVLAVYGRERSLSHGGHIIKLRYTPLQGRVLSVEEEKSPYHAIMAKADDIRNLPVAVGSLHSMLAPLIWTISRQITGLRIVYLMSDGAALPLGFSKVVELLKERGLLHKTITFGHAFGGDLEAVNVYSALLAAKHVLKADLAIILMGPGVVGTQTTWGTTAIEQGVFLNAVIQLGGIPVAIPRLSEGDGRKRHLGLSHHTQTVLRRVVQSPVFLPLPLYFQNFPQTNLQLEDLPHKLFWFDTTESYDQLFQAKLPMRTMGRGLKDDPLFFHSLAAAGLGISKLLKNQE